MDAGKTGMNANMKSNIVYMSRHTFYMRWLGKCCGCCPNHEYALMGRRVLAQFW